MGIKRIITLTGLIAAVYAMTGCNDTLKDENALLLEENKEIRAQLADRNSALDAVNRDLREAEMENTRLQRELDASQMQTASQPAATTGFEGIAGVTGVAGAGEVTAVVEGDVLFASGKTTLKAAAKQSLDAVASVLNSTYSGRSVRITGHTDSDPIRKSGFKSNYHLGFERAYAVRDYLISRGVSATRLSLASFGPDRPQGTKEQSRRVEIVVILN